MHGTCCCSLPPSACKNCLNYQPDLFNEINKQIYKFVYQQTGWICPVCGCGVAPNITQCSCNLSKSSEII